MTPLDAPGAVPRYHVENLIEYHEPPNPDHFEVVLAEDHDRLVAGLRTELASYKSGHFADVWEEERDLLRAQLQVLEAQRTKIQTDFKDDLADCLGDFYEQIKELIGLCHNITQTKEDLEQRLAAVQAEVENLALNLKVTVEQRDSLQAALQRCVEALQKNQRSWAALTPKDWDDLYEWQKEAVMQAKAVLDEAQRLLDARSSAT